MSEAAPDPRGKSFAIYGGFAHWPAYHGRQTPEDVVRARGGRVVYGTQRVDQDLGECMGLQGKLCKHILVLLIGLTRTGALPLDRAATWAQGGSRKAPLRFPKAQDALAQTLLRYKGAQAGEVDWRPTETVPEDFLAF